MKTTEEMIAIMQAYADGKKIEFFDERSQKWLCPLEPIWCWDRLDYRIKEEPKFRPFKDAEECWLEMNNHEPFGWVKINNKYLSIEQVTNNGIWIGCEYFKFDMALSNLSFIYGTPFGIKEE